jgi:hypothetical protein
MEKPKIIVEKIENKKSEIKNDKNDMLWISCKKVVSDTINHNKNIISQMSSYDIHDEEHSEKILEIEEALLGEKINDLSFSELLLLYLSAYLHDSAMALPEWEYKALKAVEGTDDCYDSSVDFAIRNDLKAKQEYFDVKKIVNENKDKIFNYNQAKDYIFAPSSEEELIEEIISLIREYEEFRSAYYDTLEDLVNDVSKYIEYSEKIRIEFIRQKHHIRAEKNVKRLTKLFKDSIGERETERFTDILAKICRAHGENLLYVKELPTEFIDFNKEICNAQFIAIMLRIGDIVHFDYNRAPISLFAEKQIRDSVSIMHWMSKNQELEYNINSNAKNIDIGYSAYCKTPETYYFIQNYMDWIDDELSNYYHLKNYWQSEKLERYEHYDLPLAMNVDRSELGFDSNIFRPDRNMKFVLDQNKILELFMGVGLYQDELLCLRELYQNALDASKCMRAYNSTKGIKQELPIVFGIGKELINGKEQEYIYCLDHGMGMDDYIIKNYLLNIGSSYYKSADFKRANADWNFNVIPTSQFGIGLLSGFMLADKIGVTSVYRQNQNKLSCIIEKHGYSYYNTPKIDDIEKIGAHGTMIKLYLKSEYEERFNNKTLKELPWLLMMNDSDLWEEYYSKDMVRNNLQYIIFNIIGITEEGIPLLIEDDNGCLNRALSAVSIFDYRNYPDIKEEDIEKIFQNYHYFYMNFEMEMVKNRDNIVDYLIEVQTENIKLYSHIALPLKGANLSNIATFDYCYFLGKKERSIYVDGIYVDYIDLDEIHGDGTYTYRNWYTDYFYSKVNRYIIDNSIINHIGEKRPILSVDRNSIISFPSMDDELHDLEKRFNSKLIEIIKSHIEKENYHIGNSQVSLILKIVLRKFPDMANDLIWNLEKGKINLDLFVDKDLQRLSIYSEDLFRKTNLYFESIDFRKYGNLIKQTIVLRLLVADSIIIDGDSLTVEGDTKILNAEFVNDKYGTYDNIPYFNNVVIKSDKWEGEYSEYDMVNSLWPIVSPNLYNTIINYYELENISNRAKLINKYIKNTIYEEDDFRFGNYVPYIANLDPVMINPDIGILSTSPYSREENNCYVGIVGDLETSFYLYEFNEYYESNEAYLLYVFYNPRELNDLEEKRYQELKEQKAEYCKGLKEGFSVLYIGGEKPNYVISSGKKSKNEMLKKVPDGFWTKGVTYYDMKGEIVHEDK